MLLKQAVESIAVLRNDFLKLTDLVMTQSDLARVFERRFVEAQASLRRARDEKEATVAKLIAAVNDAEASRAAATSALATVEQKLAAALKADARKKP